MARIFLWENLINLIKNGKDRSVKAKRNIILSLVIKGFGIAINLALVPIAIKYLNPAQYGIWLTLSSIVNWFSFFDLGIGHGTKNFLANSIALGNSSMSKEYISTTYAVLTLIFSGLFIAFLFINSFLDWSKILNTTLELKEELTNLVLIVFGLFCLQSILKTINILFLADQKPSTADFVNLMSQLLVLILVLVLTQLTDGSLFLLGLAIGISPIIIYLISSIYAFKNSYRKISPSFDFVKFSLTKKILGLGIRFFIIQVSNIIILQTSNLVIIHICAAEDVTIFNIAFKYLSIALMSFSIILSPFWVAFTDAQAQRDRKWMESTLKNLRLISYIFIFLVVILVFLSKTVYQYWIGDVIIIPLPLTIIVGILVVFMIIIALNAQILNGLGKTKTQMVTALFGAIFHIPLALFLGRSLGVIGVVLSSSFFYFIIAMFTSRQVKMLIDN